MALSETLSEIDHLDDDERDCIENVADIASLSARFMARDSNYSTQLAEVCAGVSGECAEECEQHDADHCQVCADVLEDCVESCRNMVA